MPATDKRTVTGRCPDHGIVEGTKDIPKVSFPFIVYGIRRAIAARKPGVCPTCGARLSKP